MNQIYKDSLHETGIIGHKLEMLQDPKSNLSWFRAIKILSGCTVLMDHPISPIPFGSTTTVEDQSLLHADNFGSPNRLDCPILARRLPVPTFRRSVQSLSVLIFPILRTEEEPLVIVRLYQRLICNYSQQKHLISKHFYDPVPNQYRCRLYQRHICLLKTKTPNQYIFLRSSTKLNPYRD